MPYRKSDPQTGEFVGPYYIAVPTRHGGWVRRSSLTTRKTLAQDYESMFRDLGPNRDRDFDLIELVLDRKVSIPELYQAYRNDATQDLKLSKATRPAAEQPVDLDPLVDQWVAARTGYVKPNTLQNYQHAVRSLIPAGAPFPPANLTRPRISEWIGRLTHLAPASKNHWLSGVRHFIKWLIERGVLTESPARGVERPPVPEPRIQYLDHVQAKRLADRQPSPFREFSAILNGTGGDVSLVLGLHVRDVDTEHKEIHLNGATEKTPYRDRWTRVADWAWPYVEELLVGKKPDELLFDPAVIDRFEQWRVHTAACAALEAEAREGLSEAALKKLTKDGRGVSKYHGYQPRDSRHTYAVRLIRAGAPPDVVGRQLGHKDARMVIRVYGRHIPRQDERAFWEQRAQEKERNDSRVQRGA